MRSTAGLSLLVFSCLLAPAQAQDSVYSAATDAAVYSAASEATEGADLLQPGEFAWLLPESAPGPVIVVVSLSDQRAYVYRNGQRIALSTVSTGKPGNETPTGVFPILQKKKVHHSNLYNDAPMPFMQRLTWDGVALHAGKIPGHPASHGCVRLPKEFARRLFEITEHGEMVVVSEDGSVEALARAGLPEHLALLVGTAALPAAMGQVVGDLAASYSSPATHISYEGGEGTAFATQ